MAQCQRILKLVLDMNYELVIGKSKNIEGLLRDRGFEGRGLHELVTDAGIFIDPQVARACRKVATIRNNLMHDSSFVFTLEKRSTFTESADFAINYLEVQAAEMQSNTSIMGVETNREGSPPPSGHNNGPRLEEEHKLGENQTTLRDTVLGYGLGAFVVVAYGAFRFWLEVRD